MGALLQGLFLLVAGFFVLPLVMWQARTRNYSWWLDTPDDPYLKGLSPHYGHYEPTVRKIYARLGAYWGDAYWLGLRNTLFGLAYLWKPDILKELDDYEQIQDSIQVSLKRWGILYELPLGDRDIWCAVIDCKLFAVIAGHRIDNIFNSEPGRMITHPNMDGRPCLTFRRKRR